jgi:hypothetical protein
MIVSNPYRTILEQRNRIKGALIAVSIMVCLSLTANIVQQYFINQYKDTLVYEEVLATSLQSANYNFINYRNSMSMSDYNRAIADLNTALNMLGSLHAKNSSAIYELYDLCMANPDKAKIYFNEIDFIVQKLKENYKDRRAFEAAATLNRILKEK